MTKAELQKILKNSQSNYEKLRKAHMALAKDYAKVADDRDRFKALLEAKTDHLHDTEELCKKLGDDNAALSIQVPSLERRVAFLQDTLENYERTYGQQSVELRDAYATLKNLIRANQREEINIRWRTNE